MCTQSRALGQIKACGERVNPAHHRRPSVRNVGGDHSSCKLLTAKARISRHEICAQGEADDEHESMEHALALPCDEYRPSGHGRRAEAAVRSCAWTEASLVITGSVAARR